MKKKILTAVVIGQAFLIVGLLVVKANRQQAASDKQASEQQATDTGTDSESEAKSGTGASESQEATLDEALQIARDGLAHLEANLKTYRCRMVSRERVKGEMKPASEMQLLIQERKTEGEAVTAPMRVYIKYLAPSDVMGREVIWEEGKRDGKLVAHEGSFNLATALLDPTGKMAMGDNLHPVYDIGLVNLVRQLIDRGENGLAGVKVRVHFKHNTEVDGHPCTRIRIQQLQRNENLDFQIADIYFDAARQLPLKYAAFGWPENPADTGASLNETSPNPTGPLLEEYTYFDVETNVEISDIDFDPKNEAYNFPSIQLPL